MQPTSCQSKQWAALSGAIGLILLIWLVVLPRVAQMPNVASRIRFMESRGIDPSARFYSELPCAMPNADEIARRMQESPDAFWSFKKEKERDPSDLVPSQAIRD